MDTLEEFDRPLISENHLYAVKKSVTNLGVYRSPS